MTVSRNALLPTLLLTVTLPLTACSATSAKSNVDTSGKLAACPSAPHCVNSDDTDAKHQIPALRIKGDATAAWAALKAELKQMPRIKMVEERADYQHVVATTKLLRFKDDVEFVLRAERGEIAMRSSSNIGYYDFNANRKRLEAIRSALRARGVVE